MCVCVCVWTATYRNCVDGGVTCQLVIATWYIPMLGFLIMVPMTCIRSSKLYLLARLTTLVSPLHISKHCYLPDVDE